MNVTGMPGMPGIPSDLFQKDEGFMAERSQRVIGNGASLVMNQRRYLGLRIGSLLGEGALLLITSLSLLAVLFIFYFIARDAWPFLRSSHLKEFFTSAQWYPAMETPQFGAVSIFFGTLLVAFGAVAVAVPIGLSAAVCMSDVLPFRARQYVKPVVEIIAAVPSVAFGFFALAVFAPLLQQNGGPVLSCIFWIVGFPMAAISVVVLADVVADHFPERRERAVRYIVGTIAGLLVLGGMIAVGRMIYGLSVSSGTNALNVSFILGMMALPTIVSVSEDALQASGRELREGSSALGATRAETILQVVIPASLSGIIAAVMLGIMRAVGETMVVWMASGNTARIPTPWYNLLSPVRTLTASIAGDMGEAARGTMRYHVLFAMALVLLVISFLMNTASQWVVNHSRRQMGK